MQNLDFDNMNINELAVALKLDQEEQELLASIENDDWVSVANADRIYGLANQLGKSVSGFAQEIIHKYLQGELIEKT